MLQDTSKGPGLLFGILLILAIFGIAVAIRMLWTDQPAGTIELLIFGLLAADGILLIKIVDGAPQPNPGLVRYLAVWILGVIPYFGWVVIYGAGRGIAALVERRRANGPALALLVWIAVVLLCLCVYWFVSRPPQLVGPA